MGRVLLSKELQHQLLFSTKERLGYSWGKLATYLHVTPRALENWYRCKRLIPEGIFKELIHICSFPINDYKILPDNWGLVKGGKVSYQRRGPFWTLAGSKKGGINSAKKVPLPTHSAELAEFIGIMLGDGGVAYNQISVTLGYTTDKDYVPYIRKLLHKLFKVSTSTYRSREKDFIRVRASGVNLVKNLLVLGLVQGNKIKQPQFNIPKWIQEREVFMRACIRGMIDTDGCVHRKVRRGLKGVEYRSIGITFCSYSKPLQVSLIRLFSMIGFKVAISGETIYLCGKKQVERYIEEVGFSNPKHIQRYKTFLNNYGWKKFIPQNCLITSATV